MGKFKCCNNTMVVIRMNGGACVMSEHDFNKIIIMDRNIKI